MTKSQGLRAIEQHGLFSGGQAMSPEYRAWKAMIERCENRNCETYRNYGARGITVAPEWRVSFMSFLAHIGQRPSALHSIDRIKNELGYQPGNVRWATRREQNRNRRGNRLLTLRGETRCAQDWAEHLGLSVSMLRNRLTRGWSDERALTEPSCRK